MASHGTNRITEVLETPQSCWKLNERSFLPGPERKTPAGSIDREIFVDNESDLEKHAELRADGVESTPDSPVTDKCTWLRPRLESQPCVRNMVTRSLTRSGFDLLKPQKHLLLVPNACASVVETGSGVFDTKRFKFHCAPCEQRLRSTAHLSRHNTSSAWNLPSGGGGMREA